MIQPTWWEAYLDSQGWRVSDRFGTHKMIAEAGVAKGAEGALSDLRDTIRDLDDSWDGEPDIEGLKNYILTLIDEKIKEL